MRVGTREEQKVSTTALRASPLPVPLLWPHKATMPAAVDPDGDMRPCLQAPLTRLGVSSAVWCRGGDTWRFQTPTCVKPRPPENPGHPSAFLVPSGSTAAVLWFWALPVCKLGLPPHPVVWTKWAFWQLEEGGLHSTRRVWMASRGREGGGKGRGQTFWLL